MLGSSEDEGYVCKYCKRGTIRPIQFSLNQAIINCDNTECDSFLEKWPWECIIANPVSESTLLHKHDKDSVCSSDSSGVHSDLGSSGFSQSSLADREVELLLRKNQNHHHYSRNHRTLERKANIHRSPWQISSRKHTNLEPLVARDGNLELLNEMASAGQSNDIDRKLEGDCNEAVYHPAVNSNKGENEFFNMLKDINFENEPPKSQQVPLKSKVEVKDFITHELEALLEELDQPLRSRNISKVNGDLTSYDQSPTKALIPSKTSAFNEVSPSKTDRAKIFSCRDDSIPHKEFLNNSSNCFLPQVYPVKTDFLSPTSSGYSEENSEESFANKSLYTPTIDFMTKPKFESTEICSEQIFTSSGSFKSLSFCENAIESVKNEVQRNEPFCASKIAESMSISSHASSELSSASLLPPGSSIPTLDQKISPNSPPSSNNLSLLNDLNESMDNQILETVGLLKSLEQGSINGHIPDSSTFKMWKSSPIPQALVSVTKDNASSQNYSLVQSNSFSSKDIKLETFEECLNSKVHSLSFLSQCITEESNGKSSEECSSINLNSVLETPKKSVQENPHSSNINNIKPLNLFHSENLGNQISLDTSNIFTPSGSCENPVVTSNYKEPLTVSPSMISVCTSSIQDINSDIIGHGNDATPNLIVGDNTVVAENNSNFHLRNSSGITTLNKHIVRPLIRKVSSLDMENDLPPCCDQDHSASPSDESEVCPTDQEFIEMQNKIDKFNSFINSLENFSSKKSYDTGNKENKPKETLPTNLVIPSSPKNDITKSHSFTASKETEKEVVSQDISLKESYMMDTKSDALPTTGTTDSTLSDVGNSTTVDARCLINEEPISVESIKDPTLEDNANSQQESVKAMVQDEKVENDAQIDFSPAPEWDTKNNINAHRAKTTFKGGLKVDPWSVPVLYIDELNIEVILKNVSEDEKKETRSQKEQEEKTKSRNETGNSPTTLHSPIPDSTLPSPSPLLQVPLNFPEISNVGAITSDSIISSLCSSSSSQNQSCPPTVDTQPTQSISLQEQSCSPLLEKVNIYKPISLLPEILDPGHFQDNLSGFQSSRNSKMRLSVGYQSEDGSKDIWSDSSEMSENPEEPSPYFSSLLNNLKFDENFCTLASSNEAESSIEDFVSERLFDECDNSRTMRRGNPYIKNENQSTVEGRRNKSLNCNFEEDEESDSEIPIVTIDANDELDIIIPEKKQKSQNTEGEDCVHPPNKSKSFYSPQVKSKRSHSFEESNYCKKLKTDSMNFKCCGIFEDSIPHTNSCFNSNYNVKTDLDKTSEKDISIVEKFPKKISHCNASSSIFTINKFYDHFGKLGGRLENCKNRLKSYEETSEFFDENSNCDTENNLEFFDDLYPPDRLFPPANPQRCLNSVEVRDGKPVGQKSNHLNPNSSRSNTHENNSKTLLYTEGYTCENSNPKTESKVTTRNTKSPHKTIRKSSHRPNVLGHNPSVPEVLNFLRESGWAVTPCNPVINYNVLPHARSPTIVPGPLESQYGNTGSDVILWALTDEVTYESKKDSVTSEPQRPLAPPVRSVKPELTKNIPNSKSLVDNSQKVKKNSFKQVHHNSQKRLKHFFNLSETLSTKDERLHSSVKVKQQLDSQRETVNIASNSVPLKKLRTSDGSLYIRPSFIKKEPLESVEEDALDSDGSSDGCIELPDDFVAYEEIVKEGYDVGAPPTIPESLFIPPLPPPVLKQDKRRRNAKENFKPPPSLKEHLPPTPPKSKEERILSKAEDKLTDILSERTLKDVPKVVCMTVDGKLFVYHRKE